MSFPVFSPIWQNKGNGELMSCVCLCASVSVYLLSIGVPQDIASHYVDKVGFWVDFTHKATKPPPESKERQRLNLHRPESSYEIKYTRAK